MSCEVSIHEWPQTVRHRGTCRRPAGGRVVAPRQTRIAHNKRVTSNEVDFHFGCNSNRYGHNRRSCHCSANCSSRSSDAPTRAKTTPDSRESTLWYKPRVARPASGFVPWLSCCQSGGISCPRTGMLPVLMCEAIEDRIHPVARESPRRSTHTARRSSRRLAAARRPRPAGPSVVGRRARKLI